MASSASIPVDGGVEQIAESAQHRPPARLAPYVESYIGYRYAGFPPGRHMGLPSRYLTFVITFDAPLELSVLPDGSTRRATFAAAVGGLHTNPVVIRHDGHQHGVQLQVTPAGARALFGVPAAELATLVVALDELWGPLAAELLDRLAGAPTWPQRFAVVDRLLTRALAAPAGRPPGPPAETSEAWRLLVAGAGGSERVEVAPLAAAVGWSRRHLSERFTAEYGIGPKAMARVLRFERARWMLVRPDRPSLAAVAARCGYADQAHMARDWRALAGASPSSWLRSEELPFVQDPDPAHVASWSA